ncbi:hypothetical protein ACTU44_17585 [Thalassospira sp. SM2505]|uniref:EF-hand domain-containing protein n=1 Tax=Thalassospira profundimaris TaxID=502049 RepID=A0A367WUM3_9PROT|nr:EF-hand domain-containing protein [Thalassospira profundimaris]RCK45088.1 hypothetical protein TH30_13880 [Thalassospira profundimaris]
MKNILAVTVFSLALAGSIGLANAQQGSPMMKQPGQGMMQGGQGPMQGQGMMQGQGYGNMAYSCNGMPGAGMMMGSGMMAGRMHGPDMMIVMMDTNGDGSLSLEEFQAIHARMFKHLDANGDGQLTSDEMSQR